ncbi:MAG: response regulator transcription factor [Acidobacteriota bacterium]|nr:response regulator transcription factor [Acidobacteriota bacterium]
MRVGLRTLLESQQGWSVVGEAFDGEEAVDMVLSLKPDVTLLDIAMPKINGLEATRKILAQGARTKILLLSAYDSEQVIADVLDSGAKGYVLKSEAARDLVAAVKAVKSNQSFFTPKVADLVLSRHLQRVKDQTGRPKK